MNTLIALSVFIAAPMTAFAGGELEKPEAFYIEECNTKHNAGACVTMAEQTVCGVGFNDKTAVYMKKACANHVYNCEQGNGAACTAKAECQISCLDWRAYWDSDPLLWPQTEMSGCHMSMTLPGESKAEQTNAGILLALESLTTACEKNDAHGCFVLGWAAMTEDVAKPEQGKQALQKSCDMKVAAACLMLSNHLKTDAQSLRDRACSMKTSESGLAADFRSWIRESCNKQ